MNTINKLRQARTVSSVAYQKILKIVGINPTITILLIEGEDQKYYANFINMDICTFVACDGKDKLLHIKSLILGNAILKNASILYLLDKDFDTHTKNNKNTFITEGYSIENYYCSKDVLKRFIINECSICDKSDFELHEKVLNHYYKSFTHSLVNLEMLNIWLLFQRDKEKEIKAKKRLNVNSLKVESYLKDDNKIKMKDIKEHFSHCYKWSKSDKIKYLVDNRLNPKYLKYRGKWVFKAFCLMIKDVVDDCIKKRNFSWPKKTKFRLNGNPLTELSSFADYTTGLKKFLTKNGIKKE